MTMRTVLGVPCVPALLALCLTGAAQAQTIYKWTDANGRVHYSEKKDAAATKPQEMKVAPSPPPPAKPSPQESRWREFDEAGAKPAKPPVAAPPPARQRSLSGGTEDGSDASRCNLARDVLNGVLRHGNGAAIDQHDRDIAAADVKRFCR